MLTTKYHQDFLQDMTAVFTRASSEIKQILQVLTCLNTADLCPAGQSQPYFPLGRKMTCGPTECNDGA